MVTKEKKTTRTDIREKIKEKYIDAVLTGKDSLSSVYAFCKAIRIKETTFYENFNSFNSLESSIWIDWLHQTLDILKEDQSYDDFSVREKLLSFYFTWFEILLAQRSFVTVTLQKCRTPEHLVQNSSIRALRKEFTAFSNKLIKEGEETGEIPKRQTMINNSYPNGLWLQFLFLINFWKNDDSRDFTHTDAAVEKSVNLSLDLIGRGPVDTIVDFAKFMFQQTR